MALFRPLGSAVPKPMSPLKQQQAALAAEKQRLLQQYMLKINMEKEQLQKRYEREIEMCNREDALTKRAMEGLVAKHGFSGLGPVDKAALSKEARASFVYVTTDYSQYELLPHVHSS
jgi:hypothetical protein